MRYRLGIDLGTSSIGWCMLRLNATDQPIAVIRMGVRIFSDGRNAKDGSSLAVTRRLARQLRRRRDRLLKRKSRMFDALIRLGFFPDSEPERRALLNLDPYELRCKALSEPLEPGHFARALFHLNQRRGFRSNRRTDRADAESGALKRAIGELRVQLEKDSSRTLGEWLARRHANGLSVRARMRGKTSKDRAYDFYADREMVEHEFDEIWSAQQRFSPERFTDAARDELRDILLFQRALLPVKAGRCTLIPDEERAPRALPSAQRFRILQELNNLRYIDAEQREIPLTIEQRDQIAERLMRTRQVGFSAIVRLLSLPGDSRFNLQDEKRGHLKGNETGAILAKSEHFGRDWHDFDDNKQAEIVERLLRDPSEKALVQWLIEATGVDDAHAAAIAAARLPEGYVSLSRSAIDRVLPELAAAVIPYSEAVQRAGLGSHSVLSQAAATGEILPALPYYGDPLRRHVAFARENPRNDEERFGRIANPTVHIGLNELRKVVNALIARYGNPSEIVVEVTRDLKLSRDRKREIEREQAANQKRNDALVVEAASILSTDPIGLSRAQRRELSQRMQLWHELNRNVADRCCPYTGEPIGIHRLLSDEVEIEHILPFSRTLDDSMNNKTVCLRRANRIKGNRTPFEAFGTGQPGFDYAAILARVSGMSMTKAMRFAPDGYERWLRDEKDFLARSLNDTAYLSRIAREYLSLVCPPNRVRAIPGRLTAMLRGKMGLNQLLSGTEAKNRNDHRHHALDAAVVAVTDQGLLQRFATASARARELELQRLVEDMPLPWPEFRTHVERALAGVVVSHRPDHGYQGAMHEESAWGIEPGGFAHRRIMDSDGKRQRVRERRKVIGISGEPMPGRHGLDSLGQPRPYKGYVGGSNYAFEVVSDTNGRWVGEVVSTFDAYQLVRELGESGAWQRLRDPARSLSGRPLVMRLCAGDAIRLKVDDQWSLMNVQKIYADGRVVLARNREANVDNRNRDTNDSFRFLSKRAEPLRRAGAQAVRISPIGVLGVVQRK
ncbi:MAG: type II CRISPR RNA-guided endonuclease Cas9 [Burkholderiaceae bacterium]